MTSKQEKRIYVEGLRLLYSAERQLKKTLPHMVAAASTDELRAWFIRRLEQAKEHVARLEEITTAFRQNPKGEHCLSMEFLLVEAMRAMNGHNMPERLDRELIAIAHGIEGQEIAGLGWVSCQARLLKEVGASSALEKMLEERKVEAGKLVQLSDVDVIEARDTGTGQTDRFSHARRSAIVTYAGVS